MLEALISSKTRIKLLLRLFLNPESKSYLRGLADEFEESTNSVRLELSRFEEAGMVESELVGNKKYYKANTGFSLFNEVRSILLKQTGLSSIIEEVIEKLGDLRSVYLTGDLACGKQSNVISLVFVGNPDRVYLTHLVDKVEDLIDKKIQYLNYTEEEAKSLDFESEKYLLLWNE
ncbi:winged helix-turn-helix domain-containing protein [Roseivirga spongicola]|uniref:Transcriptional regulator n=1 Tax=Roseivirga spongicola TaxID=333140 RepID=A0A150XHJ3_9BACT|nr:winged helix-turn-helix domain-containing protein [Roseivirga spongicola]KYG78181.1 transcriptional regulator [Roseivirga spongicola]WPZ11925.1 winged helix-turn-helix domain-containing protein [Roseivirga spongicola]